MNLKELLVVILMYLGMYYTQDVKLESGMSLLPWRYGRVRQDAVAEVIITGAPNGVQVRAAEIPQKPGTGVTIS